MFELLTEAAVGGLAYAVTLELFIEDVQLFNRIRNRKRNHILNFVAGDNVSLSAISSLRNEHDVGQSLRTSPATMSPPALFDFWDTTVVREDLFTRVETKIFNVQPAPKPARNAPMCVKISMHALPKGL